MEAFSQKYLKPSYHFANASTVRVKINNERKKWDLKKTERLKEIGIS